MTALLERLEGAREGSRELDQGVWLAFGGWAGVDHPPAVTQSVDAALALAERVLPGWIWDVTTTGTSWGMPSGDSDLHFAAKANTPALAICAALIRATAKEEAGG